MLGIGLGLTAIRQGGGPAPAWTPDALFASGEVGDWWDFRTAYGLFEDASGTVPVSDDGDLVGAAVGRRSVITAIQATTGNKPKWQDGHLASVTGGSTMRADISLSATAPLEVFVCGEQRGATNPNAGPAIDVRVSTADSFFTVTAALNRARVEYRGALTSLNYSESGALGKPQFVFASKPSGASPAATIFVPSNVSGSASAGMLTTEGSPPVMDFQLYETFSMQRFMRGAVKINRQLTSAERKNVAAFFGFTGDI